MFKNSVSFCLVYFFVFQAFAQKGYSVKLQTNPTEADVYIGKDYKGFTPVSFSQKVKIDGNSNVLTVKKPGYEEQTFVIKGNEPSTRLDLNLSLNKIAYKSTLGFGKIVSKISPGQTIGEVPAGYTTVKIPYNSNIEGSINESAEGYLKQLVAGNNESDIFKSKNKAKTKFLVGGSIHELFYTGKIKLGGINTLSDTKASVTVAWEVFDIENEEVVLKKEVTAYFFEKEASFEMIVNNVVNRSMGLFLSSPEVLEKIQETNVKATPKELLAIKKENIPDVVTPSEIFPKFSNSVVTIKRADGGHGTGFLISKDGFILTNSHVVDFGGDIEVLLTGGYSIPAEVIRKDKDQDVALLKIKGSGFKSAKIGNSDNLSIGDDVTIIGTPLDLNLSLTLSKGIISGKRKIEEKDFYQTDASVNQGNSGGPVFNSKGNVVGIISAKIIGKGVEGISFLIPVNDALKALNVKMVD